jgi:cysteine desulfurase
MTVYLDHNSTTPMRQEVKERYLALLDSELGNASGVHASGRRARAEIDDARMRIAASLRVEEENVVFTSGGTEANNAAILGMFPTPARTEALVVTEIEHLSVLEPTRELERRGVSARYVPVNREGRVDVSELLRLASAPECRLVSVMTANNEVGTVTSMEEIGAGLERLGEGRPVWHTDAVQALGRIPLDLRSWGVDLASFSGHKLGGPLGVGFLVCRGSRAPLSSLLLGGAQERGRRAGTENTPGIAAMALAVELAVEEQVAFERRTRRLSRELWSGLLASHPEARLCGPSIDAPDRLPNTLEVILDGTDGHALVAHLDLEGLSVSLGSACSSGAPEPSHVLLAMGFSKEEARRGLRLSLGQRTTHKDINIAVETLRKT